MTNLKFDEVEGEDILEAFDFGTAEVSKPVSEPKVESKAKAVEVKVADEPVGKTVTIGADQFSELLSMVKGLTAEVAGLKAGKPIAKKTAKATQGAVADKPKRTREQYMAELKEKSKVKAAERFAKCVAASGKSEAEVKAAFKVAHAYGAQDQSQYTARYDEKLKELIGVTKYAVAV
jgi:hypothetical protein